MSLSVQWAPRRSSGSVSVEAVKGTPTGACRSQFESGGRTYTTAWCTFERSAGKTSAICTQRSSLKFVGTISNVYSMSPLAGSDTACGIFKTKSGLGILQLSSQCRDGGASFASPAGDFASTHAASVAISADVKDGSLENLPTLESANHGGMDFSWVARRIAAASGRVSSYVSNGIGAMPPARWQ